MVVRMSRRALLIKALAFLLAPSGVSAAELELRLARLGLPGGSAEGVVAVLDWPERRAPRALAVTMERLTLETPALVLEALTWRCALAFEGAAGGTCAGPASWRDAAGSAVTGNLRLALGADALSARLTLGETRLELDWPQDATLPLRVAVDAVPAVWLQGELGALWPDASLGAGQLDGRFELRWDETDALHAQGSLRARGLGLDTADGSVAAARLDAAGTLRARLGERMDLALALDLEGGEVLFDRLYVELPARPLGFALSARELGGERWRIDELRLHDPRALRLEASVQLDLARDDWIERLDLRVDASDAGEALARYAGSLLGLAGLGGLQAEGAAAATLVFDRAGLRVLEAQATDLYLHDAQGRFGLDGLEGGFALGPDAPERNSLLRWKGAHFYRMPFGPLQLALRSGRGAVAMIEPAAVDLLGGRLAIERFRWRDDPVAGVEFEAGLAVSGLELARLTEAFGWPAFGGQLSGRIPAVSYDDGVLNFAGGLEVGVFDGRVAIERLSMERPFGVLPTLNADIRFSGLDLQQITRVFDFGEIQGRLEGQVLGLRLIDWRPVAFDARLRTERGAGPRRISQRAVESLSSVGGGGAAALQSTVLRAFSTFSYDEIGLSCRLRNHVCHMDGIDSVGQGYAIVKGSGLPRISVVGHQRQVDWPVLLGRLQAATAGAGPVMN
jgi:hypothetical protein